MISERVIHCFEKSTLGEYMSMHTAYQVIVMFSPQHPAAHGVLRLILELNGEEILRSDPVSFITSRISVCSPAIAYWSSPSWHGKTDRVQNLHASSTIL